ncbi:type VI secretion system baseplate subunit TssF [Dyella tabacisoli]|uniref:Type VI secretion system baseplate subunit TssF n=1 Tax=Dyella tabacisoli TaxID=2282381 RepID=A0A369UHF6_9GAMM|nr:type VI secretion system baseplate subunit TssF [Dyella tabacisoli]RDD80192.1 type VI secretion system baseplate subunit TssF [Dyella tabacisoli]
MLDELLPYYENELTSLRSLSKEFAARYPKIAARLALEGDVCEDPHVERLIESFAFIASRIHKKLDDDFPQITEALLSVLYPHYLRPIPSMSIAQLAATADAQLSGVQSLPRGTPLLTRAVQGMPVRYRTAYPVDVWPVQVSEAAFEPVERSAFALRGAHVAATVRIRLEVVGKTNFAALDIRRLRFYLDGESPLVHALHELLLNNVEAVSVVAPDGEAQVAGQTLGAESIKAVGFDTDDGLLDYDPRSFLGYRLLQEYFTLPEKFLFVDIDGLDLKRFNRAIELRIALRTFGRPERAARMEQTVNRDSFRLHCTPIVNLFTQQAEPIRVSQELSQYPVIPDVRRPLGLEVYSIDRVQRLTRSGETAVGTEFLPFFSTRHGLGSEDKGCYWYAQRLPSARPNDDGTEIAIALVDRAMDPCVPAVETLSLSITCTNRDLPSLLPFGGEESALQVEDGGIIGHARLLKKPTPTWRAPMRLANQWRLISHLSLNHLSIVEGGRDALLEILSLYNFADSATLRKQIAGIVEVKSRPSLGRIGKAPRQSFVRGTEIELSFDEEQYVGSGAYLLARVLELFFGLYCTANSYTRLTAHSLQREEPLATFAPRTGAQPLV